jgi:hypothetical protein
MIFVMISFLGQRCEGTDGLEHRGHRSIHSSDADDVCEIRVLPLISITSVCIGRKVDHGRERGLVVACQAMKNGWSNVGVAPSIDAQVDYYT